MTRLTVADIVRGVAQYYGISEPELRQSGTAIGVERRRIAMYLARGLTGQSLPAIARQCGGCHHTTVLDGVRAIGARLERGDAIRGDILAIMRRLEARGAAA